MLAEKQYGRPMAKELHQQEKLGSQFGIKMPHYVCVISADVVLPPRGVIAPRFLIPEELKGSRRAKSVMQNAVAHDGNLISLAPDPETVFKIHKIHKEVSAGKTYRFDHIAADHSTRRNRCIHKPDGLLQDFDWRRHQPLLP